MSLTYQQAPLCLSGIATLEKLTGTQTGPVYLVLLMMVPITHMITTIKDNDMTIIMHQQSQFNILKLVGYFIVMNSITYKITILTTANTILTLYNSSQNSDLSLPVFLSNFFYNPYSLFLNLTIL